eukprot:SAG31_NODE_17955_length_652_cov_0.602170_1_plen_36_part_10
MGLSQPMRLLLTATLLCAAEAVPNLAAATAELSQRI